MIKLKESRKIFSITKGLYPMEIVIPYIKKEYTTNHGRIKMEEIAKIFDIDAFNCYNDSPEAALDSFRSWSWSMPKVRKYDILISEVLGRANSRSSVKIDTWLPAHHGGSLSPDEEKWLVWVANKATRVFDYDSIQKDHHIEVRLSDGTCFNYEIQ